jgi:HEAT repeat protein
VINSVAVRRDAKAVGGLVKKLKDADPDVASAAAIALGHIGGTKATEALKRALPNAPTAVRPAIAEGCLRCAEGFLAQRNSGEAIELYDFVRGASVPRQKGLEATRGAILARGLDGIPLLLDQLRSADKAQLNMGLSTARELPGREVTEALATELQRCLPDRQTRILLALAERGDPAASPVVLAAAAAGSRELRLMAIGLLERLGNVSSLPVLLEAAVNDDAEFAQAAEGVLARLPGKDVDADLLTRLSASSGNLRRVLIGLAVQRRIDGALPVIVSSMEDEDAPVRAAADQAVGALGEEREAAALVKLLDKTANVQQRADLEAALVAIAGRRGAACVPLLLPLTRSSDAALRTLALHALATAGGPEALAAVTTALNDKDESVQDEAVRTLSTWPNTWPDDDGVAEPLLALARSGQKTSYQVLGLRGYLQYVQTYKKLQDDEKASKVKELLPLIQRPEEKRLAIATVGDTPTPLAVECLITFAGDPDVADEACTALLKLADDAKPGITVAERQKALRTVVEKCKNGARKKKAREKLAQLTPGN